IAAAMGVALGALKIRAKTHDAFFRGLDSICKVLRASRPTAVNLSWAVDRMFAKALKLKDLPLNEIRKELVSEASNMLEEDIQINRRIGLSGAEVIQQGANVLTHCNAGALATGGYGTALGVVRAAFEAGRQLSVFADETRPFLQGSRLTAWELDQDNIPVTVITDSMAGTLMKQGRIQVVIVGADRIAANGDVANKVGTYPVAVLAKVNGIPFYVAAPLSTIDLSLSTGDEIPIEERPAKEVATVFGKPIVPLDVPVRNIAFDVTPHELITGIITQCGIAKEPFEKHFREMFARSGESA
ncbi:MAG: S-methyl-5-thioribose-1-phosphate isomerase, partial [Deltaproteobacteria bacterium]|nr:S-methyl-5-thioribose-1-phosphate isomerase [Deltaproteobacteria bacterium]